MAARRVEAKLSIGRLCLVLTTFEAWQATTLSVCPLLEVDNAKSGNPKPVQTSVVGHFSDMPDRITLIGG
jgi:hypothetical protein